MIGGYGMRNKKVIVMTCLTLLLLFAFSSVAWASYAIPGMTLPTSWKTISTVKKEMPNTKGTVSVTSCVSSELWYAKFIDPSTGTSFGQNSAFGVATVSIPTGRQGGSVTLRMRAGNESFWIKGNWQP